MNSPPAARPGSQPTYREVEKKARAVDSGRVVRVVTQDGVIVCAEGSAQLAGYLKAPNAVQIRAHSGRLKAVTFAAVGDDRGQAGERHGRSTITTERVRSDLGILIGGDWNRKHKSENVAHAIAEPVCMRESHRVTAIRPPISSRLPIGG